LRNTKERKEIAEFLRDTKPIQSLENGWRWVDTQRQAYKKGKLSEERINLLNGIGFEWERRVGWDKRFEQLKRYKKDHGDCNVPRKYKANPQLGEWVHEQRKLYKNGKLSKERINLLKGIGFKWVLGRGYKPPAVVEVSDDEEDHSSATPLSEDEAEKKN